MHFREKEPIFEPILKKIVMTRRTNSIIWLIFHTGGAVQYVFDYMTGANVTTHTNKARIRVISFVLGRKRNQDTNHCY